MTLDKKIYDQYTEPMQSHINVGLGGDVSILELASLIKEVIGYDGRIDFDPTKPDGAPRKLMSTIKLNEMGWLPRVMLSHGLDSAYSDYVSVVLNSKTP